MAQGRGIEKNGKHGEFLVKTASDGKGNGWELFKRGTGKGRVKKEGMRKEEKRSKKRWENERNFWRLWEYRQRENRLCRNRYEHQPIGTRKVRYTDREIDK